MSDSTAAAVRQHGVIPLIARTPRGRTAGTE